MKKMIEMWEEPTDELEQIIKPYVDIINGKVDNSILTVHQAAIILAEQSKIQEKQIRELEADKDRIIKQYNDLGNLLAKTENEAEQQIKDLEEIIKQKDCTHEGTTIAHGPDADKCTECNLTWDV